jgi:diacylglycerol O-acyltransferase
MSQPILKHRLSTLDATFLYYERKEAPFHVGSTMIFDGEISAEDFALMLSNRLPLIPRYRQKVVPPPFNIGYPSWEFDPDFNIKNHIFQLQLDPPGTLEQLRRLTAQVQSRMLDRAKPLWEIYVVNGLQGKRTAIISKVHHTMVDGISGVELMNISFDHSPDPAPLRPPDPVNSAPAPPARPSNDIAGYWFDSLLGSAMDISDNLNQLQRGLLSLGGEMLKQYGNLIARPSHNPLVTLATPVSVLPFNQPNSGTLDINWQKFSFTEAHAIKERLGGTINDVMLCAISGAVIRYLKQHGFETEKATLRFFVPVNTRHQEDVGTMGNKVSALPVEVPLRLHNGLERYHYVVKETLEMKKGRVAEQFSLLLNAVGVIPPPLQALAGSLMYTTVPLVNMVCTNVPGPQTPLYILGKKLTDSYSYVPFAYAVGLTCVIFSYNHQLFISLSSDGAKMPGLGQEFMGYLAQTFAELRDYAGILQTETPTVEPLAERSETAAISETPAPEQLKTPVQPTGQPVATRRKARVKKAKANKVAANIEAALSLEVAQPETREEVVQPETREEVVQPETMGIEVTPVVEQVLMNAS